MTDIEITRLCAEAMNITHSWTATNVYFGTGAWNLETSVSYQPLHDDEQAMALVKKFFLVLRNGRLGSPSAPAQWIASERYSGPRFAHTDLNRAICECVAKMQEAKA